LDAAYKAATPRVKDLENKGDKLLLTWNKAIDYGSPITNYQIWIKKSNEIFEQEKTDCVDKPGETNVLENRECLMELTTLRRAPFYLDPSF